MSTEMKDVTLNKTRYGMRAKIWDVTIVEMWDVSKNKGWDETSAKMQDQIWYKV